MIIEERRPGGLEYAAIVDYRLLSYVAGRQRLKDFAMILHWWRRTISIWRTIAAISEAGGSLSSQVMSEVLSVVAE